MRTILITIPTPWSSFSLWTPVRHLANERRRGVDNPTPRIVVLPGAGHRDRDVLGVNQGEQLPELLLQPKATDAIVTRCDCFL